MRLLSEKNYIILEAQAASFKSEKINSDILDKKYKELQKNHKTELEKWERWQQSADKRANELYEKNISLSNELNKYKEFYNKSMTEGFNPEFGEWVLKVFQLRVNQTLSSSSKDITYLGSGSDNDGLYFLYSAVVWESNKIDLSKK